MPSPAWLPVVSIHGNLSPSILGNLKLKLPLQYLQLNAITDLSFPSLPSSSAMHHHAQALLLVQSDVTAQVSKEIEMTKMNERQLLMLEQVMQKGVDHEQCMVWIPCFIRNYQIIPMHLVCMCEWLQADSQYLWL